MQTGNRVVLAETTSSGSPSFGSKLLASDSWQCVVVKIHPIDYLDIEKPESDDIDAWWFVTLAFFLFQWGILHHFPSFFLVHFQTRSVTKYCTSKHIPVMFEFQSYFNLPVHVQIPSTYSLCFHTAKHFTVLGPWGYLWSPRWLQSLWCLYDSTMAAMGNWIWTMMLSMMTFSLSTTKLRF